MAYDIGFAGMFDGIPPRARKPFPEGALLITEHRINPNATRWQRFWGADIQYRRVPAKVGADGYIFGDFEAATEWV